MSTGRSVISVPVPALEVEIEWSTGESSSYFSGGAAADRAEAGEEEEEAGPSGLEQRCQGSAHCLVARVNIANIASSQTIRQNRDDKICVFHWGTSQKSRFEFVKSVAQRFLSSRLSFRFIRD